MQFPEFNGYRIREMAEANHFDSLIGYDFNNLKTNHLLVKLFYANMNLDHHNHQNREDCVWTMVCGVKIFLPLQRLGYILRCPYEGIDIDHVDADMYE